MIYLNLFFVFARIGLFGFGGGIAMLPIIYQSAREFQLMSADEFSNLVAISQVTPGPLAVNAATYVGYNCAGLAGAITATFSVALPEFIIMMIVSTFIAKFKDNRIVEGAFSGIRPVTVGLIASAAVFIGQSTFTSLAVVPILICGASFFALWKLKLSPVLIFVIAGVTGAILCG